MRQYEIAGEKARQEPISTMIQAQLGLSREELEAARVGLLHAQERRTSALFPAELELKRAQAVAAGTMSRLHEEQLKQAALKGPLELDRVRAQIALEQQQAATSKANELALIERRLQDASIAPLERQRLEAQRDYTRRQIDEIGHAARIREEMNPKFQAPSGEEFRVPGSTIYESIVKPGGEKGAITEYQKFEMADKIAQRARQGEQELRKLEDEATAARVAIEGKDKGGPNINNNAIDAKIEEFNAKSSSDFFYARDPKTGWLGGRYYEPKKIPLRDANNKPLQARTVYQAWLAHQRTHGVIPLDEYVNTYVRTLK